MEIVDKIEAQIIKDITVGKYRHYYLIYARKSTDEADNQKNSIPYQKAEGVKFVKKESLLVAPVTLAGFCVNGVISEKHSGFKEDDELSFTKDGLVQYDIDRPKFKKLVQYLNLGLFKGVICLCWDRISRNKGDDTIIRKLMRNGVDVRFIYANYDKTSAGALHMDIDGMFAEHHSRVTAEKVRLATEDLRERGIVTYKAPIGYLNLGSMEHKPFDPDRAPIIKKLFEKYATGEWSIADLVRFANMHGLTTPATRRRRTKQEMLAEEDEEVEIAKVSRPIIISHVHKILTNPFYTGRMLGNDNTYVRSISHEPLISDELFNGVQAVLHKKNVSTRYTKKLEYPYRGLVRCADCNRAYTPYLQKGIHYFGSRCRPTCRNSTRNFNMSFLEREVGKLISNLTLTDAEISQLNDSTASQISIFEKRRLNDIEIADHRKKKIREDLTYLRTNKLQLLKTGVYTPEALLQEENILNSELAILQDKESASDLSMKAVMEDVLNLSELLKKGYKYYYLAKADEKERFIKIIFSELSLSENTLKYKCKNGFQALESRFVPVCDPTTWLSEALQINKWIQESIQNLSEILTTTKPQGP